MFSCEINPVATQKGWRTVYKGRPDQSATGPYQNGKIGSIGSEEVFKGYGGRETAQEVKGLGTTDMTLKVVQ